MHPPSNVIVFVYEGYFVMLDSLLSRSVFHFDNLIHIQFMFLCIQITINTINLIKSSSDFRVIVRNSNIKMASHLK